MSTNQEMRRLIEGQYYWEMGENGHRSGNILKILRIYERQPDRRLMVEANILNKHKCRVDKNRHIPACNVDLTRQTDELTINKLRAPILEAIRKYCEKAINDVNAFL